MLNCKTPKLTNCSNFVHSSLKPVGLALNYPSFLQSKEILSSVRLGKPLGPFQEQLWYANLKTLLRRHLVETALQIPLALQADDLFGNLPLLKQQQCRNRAHTILSCQSLFVVDVNLADLDFAIVFLCQFIKHRRNHFAWTAPFGPKINQDGRRRFQDFL